MSRAFTYQYVCNLCGVNAVVESKENEPTRPPKGWTEIPPSPPGRVSHTHLCVDCTIATFKAMGGVHAIRTPRHIEFGEGPRSQEWQENPPQSSEGIGDRGEGWQVGARVGVLFLLMMLSSSASAQTVPYPVFTMPIIGQMAPTPMVIPFGGIYSFDALPDGGADWASIYDIVVVQNGKVIATPYFHLRGYRMRDKMLLFVRSILGPGQTAHWSWEGAYRPGDNYPNNR